MADLDTLTYYSFLAIFCTAIILFFIKINEIAYTLMLMSILLIYIFNIVIEGKKSLGSYRRSPSFIVQFIEFIKILFSEISLLLLTLSVYGQFSLFVANKSIIENKEISKEFIGLSNTSLVLATVHLGTILYGKINGDNTSNDSNIISIVFGLLNLIITVMMYIQINLFRTDG